MFFPKDLPTQQMLQGYRDRYPAMDIRAVDEALRLLRRGSLLMRELEAYFALYGLSQTRFLILIVIDRETAKKGLLPSEIANKLDVSRPVVTDTIKSMERACLLKSIQSVDDGRAKRVLLTPEGTAALAELLPGYFSLIDAFMTRCEGDEV